MSLQEFEMYKPKEQIKKWNEIKDGLGLEEKIGLIEEIIKDERDFWGYINLLAEVLFDVALDSEEYVQILEKVTDIIKNDMAQGPFLQTLVLIGERKKDIAIRLRNKIIETSGNNALIVLSGLILGGIGKRDSNYTLSLIEEKINSENNPSVLQSYLKSILVMNEKQEKIGKKYIQLLKKLLEIKNEKLNIEILNFCLSNYQKNRLYFYKSIKSLISEDNENYRKFLFGRLTYLDIIEENRLFELIEISKDSGKKVLDEILMCLEKYPSKNREILSLCFYWINKGLYFKIKNFDWVLEQLMKKDNSLLTLFAKSFRKINVPYSYVITPGIFEKLAKYNTRLALSEAINIKPRNKLERQIKLKLFRVIIGCCYKDKKNLKHIQRLAKYLIKEAENRPYIEVNIKSDLLDVRDIDQDKYNSLVDKVSNLLHDLEVRWGKRFNYSKIFRNLDEYPYVKKYGKDVLARCREKKKYSPLLRLLENEVPDITKYKPTGDESDFEKSIKISYLRSEFWPRACLTELNKGLLSFELIKNHKYKTQKQKKKYIQDNLMNNESFWRFFSEIIVMNKLGKKSIKSKDFVSGDNDIDLETELFNKIIFFEITAPDMDRNLRFANGAVSLKNKSFSVIEKKYKQIMKTGVYKDSRYKNKFYFYVVIDISDSTIDEYSLLDTLFGTEKLNLIFDKKQGDVIDQYETREQNSLVDKNKKTEIVSGVIYFKRKLNFGKDNQPFIKLNGKIINNPFGKRTLSEKEVKDLSKILFVTNGE